MTDHLETLQANVFAAIDGVTSKIETHLSTLESFRTTSMAQEMPAARGGDETWAVVASRKTSKSAKPGQDGQIKKLTVTKKLGRSRPLAIMVDVSEENYAKKIRSENNAEVIGDHVIGIRKTKNGGLLIELREDPIIVEKVRAELARTAGEGIRVKTLQKKEVINISDLDEWSDKPEIIEAVSKATGVHHSQISIHNLWRQYGRAQTAAVLVPQSVARALLVTGRLKIGMINCRLRLGERRTRCYQCLCFDHVAEACLGPDRKNSCWRCGTGSHKANMCTASEKEVNSFNKLIISKSKQMEDLRRKPTAEVRMEDMQPLGDIDGIYNENLSTVRSKNEIHPPRNPTQ